jgi:hypothetical protein
MGWARLGWCCAGAGLRLLNGDSRTVEEKGEQREPPGPCC